MSAAFWKVFELAISVWENILLLEFCMDFMQQKPRGKKGKILWGIAVLFGLIFPALEKYPALYDSDPFRRQFCPSRKCCIVYSRSGYSKNCARAIIKNFLFFCW